MAVQYAVAHSGSISGVGSIAGPAWGCAQGSLANAVNQCMCGRSHLDVPEIQQAAAFLKAKAADLEHLGAIDPFASGKPRALMHSYVFQSPADPTVVMQSGQVSARFLKEFIGSDLILDTGDSAESSDGAGHGIIAPDPGNESCAANGQERTFVRYCGKEDNAGKLLHALYGNGRPFDQSKRMSVPDSEVWRFSQQPHISKVRSEVHFIAADSWFFFFPWKTERRTNFDMADDGYLYVPPSCRPSTSHCRVHVALHGCRQNAEQFARRAGYNNWAEYYNVIVVYPAIEPSSNPVEEEACRLSAVPSSMDDLMIKENRNGCWDWWGYLDIATGWPNRYLTQQAPQMRVIENIIRTVTTK
jgi:hypothetical protein